MLLAMDSHALPCDSTNGEDHGYQSATQSGKAARAPRQCSPRQTRCETQTSRCRRATQGAPCNTARIRRERQVELPGGEGACVRGDSIEGPFASGLRPLAAAPHGNRRAFRVSDSLPHQLLADVVLSMHVGIVVFVVAGLAFIIVGYFQSWRWANALWFRLAHLAAIGVVVAESWLGVVCPLTSAEMWLRTQARATTYDGSFIEHWLGRIVYHDAPSWVFTAAYSLFGLVVAATWWFIPPRPGERSRRRGVSS